MRLSWLWAEVIRKSFKKMVEVDLGLVQQGIFGEAERRHTKTHNRDPYVAKVLFREWS